MLAALLQIVALNKVMQCFHLPGIRSVDKLRHWLRSDSFAAQSSALKGEAGILWRMTFRSLTTNLSSDNRLM